MQKKTTQYYVYRTKDREGPYSETQMIEMLQSHALKSNHFVWWEGQKDWKKVAEIDWPFDLNAVPPAPPPMVELPPVPQFVSVKESIPPFREEFSALLELQPSEDQDSTAIIDRSSLRVAAAEARRAEKIDRKSRQKIYPDNDKDPVILFFRFTAVLLIAAVCSIVAAAALGYAPARGLAGRIGKVSYILVNWFSPIPILSDITPAEYQSLRKIASDETGTVARFELVQSRDATQQPTLYFTTNLPDGVTYRLEVQSVTGRIVGRFKFHAAVDFFPLKNFARLAIHDLIAKDIPQGEYFFTIRESLQQSDMGKRILEQWESKMTGRDSRVVAGQTDSTGRIFIRKVFFIGGKPDQAFLEKLTQYQNSLKIRVNEELVQLVEMVRILKSTEAKTLSENSAANQGKTGRIPASAKMNTAEWLDEFREKVLGRLQGKSADYYRDQFLLGEIFVAMLSATVRLREEVTAKNGLPDAQVFDEDWKIRFQEIEKMLEENQQKIKTGEFFSYSQGESK